MVLERYERRCGFVKGGVKAVALIAAEDVRSVAAGIRGRWADMSLEEGCEMAVCEFSEQGAVFEEHTKMDRGIGSVVQTLRIELGTMDEQSRRMVEQIVENSNDGMVALIKMQDDRVILAGYSSVFASENPMRCVSAAASTRQMTKEKSCETVVLEAKDRHKAGYFAGQTDRIPGLEKF